MKIEMKPLTTLTTYGLLVLAIMLVNIPVTPLAHASSWTSIRSVANEQPTTGALIGNLYYVYSPNTVAGRTIIYSYSATSPYPLVGSLDVTSTCSGSAHTNILQTTSGLLMGCANNLILFTPDLGLVNSTSTPAGIIGVTNVAGIISAISGSSGTFYNYESTNFVKCSTNVGDCNGKAYAYGTACGTFGDFILDGTNQFLLIDDQTNTKVCKFDFTLTFIASWSVDRVLIAPETDMAIDPSTSFIWHTGNSGVVKVYNNAGVLQQTLSMPAGFTDQVDQQIRNGFAYWYDVGRKNVVVYFANNYTRNVISYVGDIADVGQRSTLQVSSNNIAFLGGNTGAGNGVVIVGNPTNTAGSSTVTPNTCGSTSPTPHCSGTDNCDLPQFAGLLRCNIVLSGNPPLATASQTVGAGVNALFTGSGLINSTNTNIKTNGVGYIIVAVGLGVLISMFWLASGGDLKNIPTFVWFIATLALLGVSTAVGWVDVTFFLVGAIAVIALASAKIMSTLELGGF